MLVQTSLGYLLGHHSGIYSGITRASLGHLLGQLLGHLTDQADYLLAGTSTLVPGDRGAAVWTKDFSVVWDGSTKSRESLDSDLFLRKSFRCNRFHLACTFLRQDSS